MRLSAAVRRARRVALLCLALMLLGALSHIAEAQEDSRAWLAGVARTYRAFGRVDDELRWAPFLCRMPMASSARVSRAAAGPHGQKVYFVYASDRGVYLGLTRGGREAPPTGFTVVKEAFSPRRIAHDELDATQPGWASVPIPGAPEASEGAGFPMLDPERDRSRASSPNVYRPVRDREGHLTGAGSPRGLYVMRYVGPGPETDEGWVYGTVDATGTITSSGRNPTCMGCHRSAPHGRLFGDDG